MQPRNPQYESAYLHDVHFGTAKKIRKCGLTMEIIHITAMVCYGYNYMIASILNIKYGLKEPLYQARLQGLSIRSTNMGQLKRS